MTIRTMRDRTGLSQNKFAAYFGIPVANIQHWEQGVAKPPSYVVGMMLRILKLEKRIEEDAYAEAGDR